MSDAEEKLKAIRERQKMRKAFVAVDCADQIHPKSAIMDIEYLLDLVSRPTPAVTREETGWLIELNQSVSRTPTYYGQTDEGMIGWTIDNLLAVRFARREDAERVINCEGYTEATAIEHAWGFPVPRTLLSGATVAVDRETKALADIVAERARQVSAEGWTPEHDDEHNLGELALAAGSYAINAGGRVDVKRSVHPDDNKSPDPQWVPRSWPPLWSSAWWKPKDPRRDLVRAGALIVAEIERLDRAASTKGEG